MTFQESDLKFEFSDTHWLVKKYNTHRFFKILSGAGLKGVDFIGIYQNEQVVFWEVKNYRTKHRDKIQSYLVIDNTPVFIEKIVRKVVDTLTAISVVHQYLRRQWWYRFYIAYPNLIPLFFQICLYFLRLYCIFVSRLALFQTTTKISDRYTVLSLTDHEVKCPQGEALSYVQYMHQEQPDETGEDLKVYETHFRVICCPIM